MPSETVTRTIEPSVPSVTPARIDRTANAAEAYSRVEAEILALPAEQIGRVTTDPSQASSIALGALPNLVKLRKDFQAFADADFFIKKLDTLQDYALAAFYAHIRSLPGASEKEVAALLERGKPIRESLLDVAETLVRFGIFDPTLVGNIRAGLGHLDTANDLVALAALFNVNWSQVQDKVPFDLDLVEEAREVGGDLLHAVGVTDVGPVRDDASYDWLSLRARAFRLLVNEYDQLRRAVAFLRWDHGDANAFAPALHVGTHKSRRKKNGSMSDEGEEDLPESEAPRLATGADVPPGMPGESPFES